VARTISTSLCRSRRRALRRRRGWRCASRRTRWSCRLGESQLRADHVDDPLEVGVQAEEGHAEVRRVAADLLDLEGALRVDDGEVAGVVGVEWSAVARVCDGRRTLRPRARRPVKACGLVTSWTSWRSMARTAGAPAPGGHVVVPDLLDRVRGARPGALSSPARSSRLSHSLLGPRAGTPRSGSGADPDPAGIARLRLHDGVASVARRE